MRNDRSNPKKQQQQHPFLPLTHWDEHTGTCVTILLSPAKVLLANSDGALKHFLSVFIHKVSDGRVDFSTQKSYTEGFWVLATKSGMKEKVHDLQPFVYLTRQEKTCSLLTLLSRARTQRKVFHVRCLSKESCMGSYRRQVRFFRTKDKFYSGGLIPLGGQDFLRLWNILLTEKSKMQTCKHECDQEEWVMMHHQTRWWWKGVASLATLVMWITNINLRGRSQATATRSG